MYFHVYKSPAGHTFIALSSLSYDRPKALLKPALHLLRSRASSFKWEYPLLSLMTSSSFLRLLPRLSVTSIPPFIFPSITHCRGQFLHEMWPIHLAFRLILSCRIFLCSFTLSNTSSFIKRSIQLISILSQQHISNLSRCFWSAARIVQVSAPYKSMLYTFRQKNNRMETTHLEVNTQPGGQNSKQMHPLKDNFHMDTSPEALPSE